MRNLKGILLVVIVVGGTVVLAGATTPAQARWVKAYCWDRIQDTWSGPVHLHTCQDVWVDDYPSPYYDEEYGRRRFNNWGPPAPNYYPYSSGLTYRLAPVGTEYNHLRQGW